MTDDFDDDGVVWSVCLGYVRVCVCACLRSLSLSLSLSRAMCVCARMKEVYIFCRYILCVQ